MSRLYLSPPDMRATERERLLAAFDSNWIAPVGPDLAAFEREFAEHVDGLSTVALSSGSAALHLALVALRVGAGDDVLVSDFTFAATANPVSYVGARPVFIDSERETWNMDPALLEAELVERAARGDLPAAVICVDLYGQCADYDAIVGLCERFEVPLIEDAAESLGARYRGRAAGSFGRVAAFSFNGNKIITTSGGGMLASSDPAIVEHVRHLSTQARQPVPHYEHAEVGFNYRLSNLLAALGRGQLRVLEQRIERRRAINDRYREALADLPGVGFAPRDVHGTSNCWLTCVTIDPACGIRPEDVRMALERDDIESRPLWKPMHLQPVFAEMPARLSGVSAELFERGLCLPSGTSMSDDDLSLVIERFRSLWA
jgi:dTDP-4-amino-4,6-dideoxygalactose transaminase